MKIQTSYFDTVSIKKEDIINFKNGIPGFLEEKEFVLLPLTDDGVYQVLQSVQTPSLAFVVTNPFIFFPDYDFELEDMVVGQLKIEEPTDVKVLNVLTIQEPFNQTTANLQAPIIINKNNNKAKQVILNDTSYTTKHKLFRESKAKVKG